MTMKEIFAQFAEENNIPMGELKLEPEAPDQLYIRLDGENGATRDTLCSWKRNGCSFSM